MYLAPDFPPGMNSKNLSTTARTCSCLPGKKSLIPSSFSVCLLSPYHASVREWWPLHWLPLLFLLPLLSLPFLPNSSPSPFLAITFLLELPASPFLLALVAHAGRTAEQKRHPEELGCFCFGGGLIGGRREECFVCFLAKELGEVDSLSSNQ